MAAAGPTHGEGPVRQGSGPGARRDDSETRCPAVRRTGGGGAWSPAERFTPAREPACPGTVPVPQELFLNVRALAGRSALVLVSTALVLVVLELALRLLTPPPPPPDDSLRTYT